MKTESSGTLTNERIAEIESLKDSGTIAELLTALKAERGKVKELQDCVTRLIKSAAHLMSYVDKQRDGCKHNWIGNVCSRCGVGHHIEQEHKIAKLTESTRELHTELTAVIQSQGGER